MRRARLDASAPLPTARSMQMLDIIMLALGLAFFALSVGYTIACDRL
jgi:SNF family Na+-dependent transporter